MRKLSVLFTLGVATLLIANANAQQFSYSSVLGEGESASESSDCCAADSCCASDCGASCCCDQSALIFGAEMTFFRYHTSDGVEDDEFDFEISPRITLGYRAPDGLGLRVRWWEYDHENGDSTLEVDTYNFDIELFEEISVGSCSSMEVSAGIRYNEFEENDLDDGESHSFEGFGGLFAVEANRELAIGGAAYARLRQAILMDDYDADGTELVDVVVGMTEIGLGYETTLISGCYCVTGHAGIEWQQWHDYSNGDND